MHRILFAALTLPSLASAATLQVGSTRQYTRINDAIQAASDGDIIEVDAGTYSEGVVVDGVDVSIIALDGATQTFIDANNTALVIRDTSDVNISGFSLESNNSRGFLIENSKVKLSDIIVDGLSAGDGTGGSIDNSTVEIDQSSFTDNDAGSSDGGHISAIGSSLTITNTSFSDGIADDGGALLLEECEVLIQNSTFSQNLADGNTGRGVSRGGAIAATDTTLTIENTNFTENFSADGENQGGAIHCEDSDLVLDEVTFTGNESDQLGGAIYLLRGSATLDVTITTSSALWRGAGLFAFDTDLTIEDSDFGQNTVTASNNDPNGTFSGSGAALWIEGGSYSISNSVFTENDAETAGGAIFTDIKGLITNSTFTDNTSNFGGAIYLLQTGVTIDASSFTGNNANVNGGAIRDNNGTSSLIENTSFELNSAAELGGVYATVGGNVTFTNVTATSNSATGANGQGGTLYCESDGSLTVQSSNFDQNVAGQHGGALAAITCDTTVTGGDFEQNTADSEGGAVYISNASVKVDGANFTSNEAVGSGGALRFVDTSYQNDIEVSDCSFNANTSGNYGGGIGAYQGGNVTITDSWFTQNDGVYGGGISLTRLSDVQMRRNWLCQNSASTHGGGMRVANMLGAASRYANNLFVENNSNTGGGLFVDASAGANFVNNTLLSNSATSGGSVYATNTVLTSTNNLVAHTDTGYGIDGSNVSLGISYNLAHDNLPADINGVAWTSGTGNISGDPLFTEYTDDGDCSNDRLWPQAGSPVIDAGDPSIQDTDGSNSDIGAFGGPSADGLIPDDDGDGYTLLDDCDDTDPTIFPGAVDDCDGIDNDCDGQIDGGLSFDDDGDGFTTPGSCGGSADDCDDADELVNPAAEEVCDAIDNDCDGQIDGSSASDALTFYEDLDADGYGNDAITQVDCAVPAGYSDTTGDCDDGDPLINPAADETCDGIDNNCDSVTDGPDSIDAVTYYADGDADGYGDNANPLDACSLPADYVVDNTDCNDTDAAINPAAVESCDGVDNNCDTAVDEGLTFTTYYNDTDLDGFGDPNASTSACLKPPNTVDNDEDCNDADATVNPTATEVCEDGIDQDCDGIDDSCTGDDSDGDGYCDASICSDGSTPGDCDDTDASIYPGASEICDTIDNNCDGQIDEGLSPDDDSDGYTAPGSCQGSADDCDDFNAAVNPGAAELCDGLDNDCDTSVDEDATDAVTYYADTDGDTYGDPSVSTVECAPPAGYVEDNTDCDDTLASRNPGESEVCDGADNDCDGAIDNGLPFSDWYADTDSDGFGDAADVVNDCAQPAGYVDVSQDCDDTNPAVNPNAEERCNDIDDNCDTVVDDDAIDRESWYADTDNDGFGDVTIEVVACDPPAGYVQDDQDCDDANFEIYPGAPEECEDIEDRNCDGILPNTDNDNDGYISCEDCDDENPEIYPEAFDLPGDGIDADCNGVDPSPDVPLNDEKLKAIGGCGCESATPMNVRWMWVLPIFLVIRRRTNGHHCNA